MRAGESISNIFTVDLEDWFQGLEIDSVLWGGFESRLRIGTDRLLEMLDRAGAKATFFVLGYAAEQAPDLVREIHERGHEIGTHGYGHEFVYQLGPDRFRTDLQRSLEVLDRLVGVPVRGHRAPYFSIVKGTEWAFEILCESGIRFDSSVFPVANYRYGIPDAPRWIHQVGDGLMECPLSTMRIFNRNLPICGGAYFRLYPYALTQSFVRRLNQSGRIAVFYMHPWELDPDQPNLKLPRRIGLTHYWNLAATSKRLRRLLDDFRFTTMGRALDEA